MPLAYLNEVNKSAAEYFCLPAYDLLMKFVCFYSDLFWQGLITYLFLIYLHFI